jgi:chromosome segregation ATPase
MLKVGTYPVDGGPFGYGDTTIAKKATIAQEAMEFNEVKGPKERSIFARDESNKTGGSVPKPAERIQTVEGLKKQIEGIQSTIHDLKSDIERLKQKFSNMSSAGHRERHHHRAHNGAHHGAHHGAHDAAARSGLTDEIRRLQNIILRLEQEIDELNKEIDQLPHDGPEKAFGNSRPDF